jgi:glutaminyl-tRNA synthetase
MVVFDPLKIILTNYTGETETLVSENNPEDPSAGSRELPFGKTLFIEREDFMENPPKKFFRLAPGQMVRLKSAYIIRCEEVIKDAAGNIEALHCTYIPESKSGADSSGINVKGTLHWVEATQALPVQLNLYDRLFQVEDVAHAEGDFKDHINPHSLQVIGQALAEPAVANDPADKAFQFLRKGYFVRDNPAPGARLSFNRTVGLKDTWAKEAKKA